MRLHYLLLAVFGTLWAFVNACAAGEITTRPVSSGAPRFDPVNGSIVASVGDVVAWKRYDPRGNGRSEASYYTARYYVQHLGGDSVLAYESGDRGRYDEIATVLSEDTVLLWRVEATEGSLLWMRDGRIQKGLAPGDIERLGSVMALFPNGLVARRAEPAAGVPDITWWVPIQNGNVNVGQRVKMGAGASAEFLKSGNQIAWIDSTHVPAEGEPAGRVPLCVFDIARRQTRSVKIQDPVGEGAHLSAFDGRHGIEGTELFDTSTGEVEDIRAMGNLTDVLRHTPLALIDDRAYFVLERRYRFEVMAVPVNDLARGKIVYQIAKSALAKESFQERLSPKNLFFASEKTIYAWNGTTWENILAKK